MQTTGSRCARAWLPPSGRIAQPSGPRGRSRARPRSGPPERRQELRPALPEMYRWGVGPSDTHPEALKTLPAGKGYFLCLERLATARAAL
ncbi:uncharacterized protein C10orf143 homolog isoform X2 [Ochotona princeps]|uniref:uncharacterized protein C10orf143 homolog isoform X2 n=1 Tax=Ochotona princeps TaxID=9978 RepID=UPI002714DC72|nr:uncharacterized protein C10orf143 homolog isoform X2 [Ochotona princeps]